MKKTLAVLMALTMLLALCIPAFAASPLDQNNPGPDNTSIIKTSIDELPSPEGYFSVTFPAETKIAWQMTGDSHTLIDGCSMDSHLVQGKTLQVTVAADGASEMTATDPAVTTKLAYTLSGDTSVNMGTPVVNNHAFAPYVDIAEAQWSQAVVGEYTANLTFTAEVL